MTLNGQVCIVTGATRGIGRAVLELLVQQDAKVIGTYRDSQSEAENMTMDMPIDMHRVDMCKPQDVRAFFEKLSDIYRSIDGLVNNAGVNIPGSFKDVKIGEWAEVLDTNLRGPFLAMKYAQPLLAANASVVNVSSVSGMIGGPFTPSYAASKAGLEGLSRTFARTVADKGIRVNCVAPGQLDAGMPGAEKAMAWHREQSLIGLAQIEDVARTIVFLLGTGSITGQTIRVDGGETLT